MLPGPVVLDFEAESEDPHDVLSALEPKVQAMCGERDLALQVEVYGEAKKLILRGIAKNGFSDIVIL